MQTYIKGTSVSFIVLVPCAYDW